MMSTHAGHADQAVRRGDATSGDFRLIDVRRFGRYALLTIAAPDLAALARPGQFVMVRVPGPEFHLRRPISLHSASDGRIRLLIEPRGPGSAALAAAEPGSTLAVAGPLGNGFPLDGVAQALVVAGGIGTAPCQALVDALLARDVPVSAAFGFKDEGQARLAGAFQIERLTVATEDGSVGRKGTAVDLAQQMAMGPEATVFACGPIPMLEALAEWTARSGMSGYASLEAHMACGTGACQGCVIPTDEGYVRVCVEGPVFPFAALQRGGETG